MVLIDGVELARLMVDNNLGCSMKQVYEIKQIDSDYSPRTDVYAVCLRLMFSFVYLRC